MKAAQLNLHFALFAYSGNGGVAGTIPEIAEWLFELGRKLGKDERIGQVTIKTYCDTPITHTRCKAVLDAQNLGADVLMMIDSDNEIDRYVKKGAKPFWDTSFDFLYRRKLQGIPTVIFAPYCGPPPSDFGGEENPYLFQWQNNASDEDRPGYEVKALTRNQAAQLTGIVEMAAGPTGVILYTLDAFDVLQPPYFYYEYTDKYQTEKASTEDITNTRDISMAGWEHYRQPIVFANMDCWAGHRKVKTVGKPTVIGVDTICDTYREAVKDNIASSERVIDVDFSANLEQPKRNGTLPKPVKAKDLTSERWNESDIHSSAPAIHSSASEQPAEKPKLRRKKKADSKQHLPAMPRLLWGHKVEGLIHETRMPCLSALKNIAENMSEYRKGPLRIIEIGSWVGESAIAFAKGLKNGGNVFCVDHWEGGSDYLAGVAKELGSENVYKRFEKNCGTLLGSVIKPMRGNSLEVAQGLDPQCADIIFLDGSHDYESVKADIEAWLPHLAYDGILCGHDWELEGFEVRRAVEEKFGSHVKVFNNTVVWAVLMRDYLNGLERSDIAITAP